MVNSDVLLLNSTKIKDSLNEGLNSYKSLPVKIDFIASVGEYPKLTMSYNMYHTILNYHGINIWSVQNNM